MRHRKHTFKIGRTSSHRRAMLANMACSLITEGQIKTSVTRAKELRRVVERMITLGKNGTLHDRRRAIAFLRQPAVARTLFTDVAPKCTDRQGGYTRILKIGTRRGDASEQCIVQLVTEPVQQKQKSVPATEEEPAAASVAAETAAKAAAEAEETVTDDEVGQEPEGDTPAEDAEAAEDTDDEDTESK